jgi:hypothetical protein
MLLKYATWQRKKVSLARGIASLIELFTRRSGHLPMELYAHNTCNSWDHRTIQSYLRPLRRAMDRFRLVSLIGCSELTRNLFPRRCTTSAALLAELRVTQYGDTGSGAIRVGQAVLNAPLLERVHVTSETSYRQLLSTSLARVTEADIK